MDINQRFIDLTTSANNKDAEAIITLYDLYTQNLDAQQTFDNNLIDFYKDYKGKPYSMQYYAYMKFMEWGVEKDIPGAIKLLKKSAELGCSEAYIVLIMMIDFGDYDGNKDELIELACNMNNPSGWLLKARATSTQTEKDTINYTKKAIKLGNSMAMFFLAEYYHNKDSYSQAIKYYKMAMEKDNYHAYFNYAVMAREGEGMKKDAKLAKIMFRKAAKFGSYMALNEIGNLYAYEGNMSQAEKYWRLAADKDVPFAWFNLGKLLYEENRVESITAYLHGARLGDESCIIALNRLGIDANIGDDDIEDAVKNRQKFHDVFKNFGAYDGEW